MSTIQDILPFPIKMKNIPTNCIECGEGHYESHIVDYRQVIQDGTEITVPHLEIFRCNHCGTELIPAASSRKISEAIAKANDQLTPTELTAFMEEYALNQTEVADICGFGEKTFHRWLKGTQVVSRSMGFYLRVLKEFPEAFEFVRHREWKSRGIRTHRAKQFAPIQKQFATDITEEKILPFPALKRRNQKLNLPMENPALIFGQCEHG